MTRRRLENRRSAETFNFEIARLRYVCTIGRFPDGAIAELFITNSKPSSQSDANARDAAVAASLAPSCSCLRARTATAMAATLGKPTIVCACDGAVQRELCHCAFGTFVNGVDELFSVLDRIVGDSSPKE